MYGQGTKELTNQSAQDPSPTTLSSLSCVLLVLLLEMERASRYPGLAAADLESCTRFPFLVQFLPSLQFSGGGEGESISWKEAPVEAALRGEQRRTIWPGT